MLNNGPAIATGALLFRVLTTFDAAKFIIIPSNHF